MLALVLLAGLSGCSDDAEDRSAGASTGPVLSSGPAAPTAAPTTPTSTPRPTPSEPPALESCPARFLASATPWVPAPPTTETPERLAPDADPVTAVVCRYEPLAGGTPTSSAAPTALVGEVPLGGGLDRVRLDLAAARPAAGPPRACPTTGGPRVPHLLRLDYADGSLWVSSVQDPGSCAASGNGVVVTDTHLGGVLSRSYDAAAWSPA